MSKSKKNNKLEYPIFKHFPDKKYGYQYPIVNLKNGILYGMYRDNINKDYKDFKPKNRKYKKIHTKTSKTCIVCDEKFENNKWVELHKTRRQTHRLCLDCAIGYLTPVFKTVKNNIRKNIRDNVGMFKCPGTYHSESRNACKTIIDLIKLKIPDEKLTMDLFRINYVVENINAYMCPNEDCGNIVDIDDGYRDKQILCIMCNTTWCKNCTTFPFHENKSCLEYECEMKNTENGKLIYELVQKGELKFCPQCKTPIKKGDGCNRMTCSQCKATWCWICKKLNIEYNHYNPKSNNKCNGKLWDGVDENGNYINI